MGGGGGCNTTGDKQQVFQFHSKSNTNRIQYITLKGVCITACVCVCVCVHSCVCACMCVHMFWGEPLSHKNYLS